MLLDQAKFITSQPTRISKKDTHTKLIPSQSGTVVTAMKREGIRESESIVNKFKESRQESFKRHQPIEKLTSGGYLKETVVLDKPNKSGIFEKPVIYFPVKASRKSSSPQAQSSIVTCASSGEQKITTSVDDTRSKSQAVKPLFARRKLLDRASNQFKGLSLSKYFSLFFFILLSIFQFN